MSRPPVCLFVYRRPDHARKTLDALKNNIGADNTPLYIFSDGPAKDEDIKNIKATRALIRNYSKDFKSVEIFEKQENIGLANSIINGATQLLDQYGRAIILEDDIVSAPNMLEYFRKALDFYEENPGVYSISAYSHPQSRFSIPADYNFDVYFIPRMMCWGWATWSSRWVKADWEMKNFAQFLTDPQEMENYRKVIGADSLRTLKSCVGGFRDVWACRWVYAHFVNNALCVCPTRSYVSNIGMDGSGTNCGIQTSSNELAIEYPAEPRLPDHPYIDLRVFNNFMKVYTSNTDKSQVVKKFKLKKVIKKIIKKLYSGNFISYAFEKLFVNLKEEPIYLGTQYGGWKVFPNMVSPGEKVLSAGVGEDISFDVALANIFNVDITLVDPTPRAARHFEDTKRLIGAGQRAPVNNGNMFYNANINIFDRLNYKNFGLWNKSETVKFYKPAQESHVSHSIGNLHKTDEYFEAECRPLKYFAKSVGDQGFGIIKLDIEGAEFSVIRNLVFSKNIRPKQLLIEFHPGKSSIEKKFRVKTLFHSFMLWLIGYRITSIDGWEYHFLHSSALKVD